MSPESDPIDQRLDLANLTRTEFVNAMVHLYRGELGEATAWRGRIDSTSHWAVVLSASALSFVFSDPGSERHIIIPIISLFCLSLLLMEARRYRFFDIWTLKEAYIKARGLGLRLPLDQFSLSVASGQPYRMDASGPRVTISFEPGLDDDPDSWQLQLLSLTDRHRCAIAIRRQTDDLVLQLFETTPLLGGRPAHCANTTGADCYVCAS